MRNLKRALSLAVASVMLLGMMVVGSGAASYPDVSAEDNLEAIEVLQLLGVMTGDDQGNFNPDSGLTRGEMAVVMCKLLGLTPGGTHPFTDVPDWANGYVAACYANGITGGTSATTYGTDEPVTAVQGALMVMKALGYFGYQGEFGSSWELATIKKANEIGLYDGVSATVYAPLTRNDVAQIALNALESNIVIITEQGGVDVSTGDGTNVNVRPTYSEKNRPAATGVSYNDVDDDVMQLVEQLYGNKVKKDVTGTKTDDFGRPAAQWTYSGKSVVSPNAADATYTKQVNADTLYSDLGLSEDVIKVNTYTDGNADSKKVTNKLITDGDKDTKWGGKGVLVEAYKIENAAGELTSVTIVVTNTYLGEVDSVDENDDGNLEVTVDGITYETSAFDEEDMVLYTKATTSEGTEITSMKLAEVVEDVEVTRVTASKSFVAGGATYEYNGNADKKVGSGDVNKNIDIYLDEYGYVMGWDNHSGESNYAYVVDAIREGDWKDDATYLARLLTAEGLVTEVEIDVEAGEDETTFKNKLVSYTVSSDDVYDLTPISEAVTASTKFATVEINQGDAKMNLGSDYYANGKTVFLLQDGTGKDAKYSAYTGIANVPDLTGSNVVGVVAANADTKLAKVVYLLNAEISSENEEIVYVLTATGEYNKDADLGEYYTYDAVVNGKITTIDFAMSDRPAADTIYSSIRYNNDGLALADKSTAYDDDATADEYYVTATVSAEAEDGTIGLTGKGYFTLADGLDVFEINEDKDEFTSSSIGRIAAGDSATLIVRNGEVVAIFWTEAAE